MSRMATVTLIVLLVALCTTGTIAKDVPVKVTKGSTTSVEPLCCASNCEKIYAQSTPKSETWFACHRGCRFFSLIELLTDGQSAEKTIRTSCLSACSEAYNETALEVSCHDGCNHQIVFKPNTKSSSAGIASGNALFHLPLSPEAWAPGFVFRVGWSRASAESGKPKGKDSLLDNPLNMIKDLFSSFLDHISSPQTWVSKTSFTYLLGKGPDGKEKLVFLPTVDGDSDEHTPPVTTRTLPTAAPVTKPPSTMATKARSTSKATRRRVETSVVATTPRPKPRFTGSIAKFKLASRWLGTAYMGSGEFEQKLRDEQKAANQSQSFWECLSVDGASSPRWVIFTLFTLFTIVFLWICGSTIYLSRQLTKQEDTLRSKGYVKISRSDPEAKNLLSDVDEFSEDDEYYYLPVPKDEENNQETCDKDGPPTYEEAQKQAQARGTECNVQFSKSLTLLDAPVV